MGLLPQPWEMLQIADQEAHRPAVSAHPAHPTEPPPRGRQAAGSLFYEHPKSMRNRKTTLGCKQPIRKGAGAGDAGVPLLGRLLLRDQATVPCRAAVGICFLPTRGL